MDPRDSPHVQEFLSSLEGWADERFVTRQELEDLTMFNLYLVNLSEADGWTYKGHSISRKETMWTLVVRSTIDGVPHVVFSSGRTTTGAIRAFLRKMREGWLEWSRDKYRQ